MSLPILQASSSETTQIRGDVTIDASAVIAVGVILNATKGNRIIIHSGVCVGMGTVITAYDGDVEIKSNAILGAGTLILGKSIIGTHASLGSSVTVYQTNIDNSAVIPAGSILGDRTRGVDLKSNSVENQEEKPPVTEKTVLENVENFSPNSEKVSHPKDEENTNISPEEKETSPNNDLSQENTPSKQGEVVGKMYINQLLYTLFPERNK